MKTAQLCQHIERDFIRPGLKDENWAARISHSEELLAENFRKRSMGLMFDFAESISKVFTAVFPSEKVMQKILDLKVHDAMLFVHHPLIWDIRKAPEVFQQIDRELLQKFREKRISIYALHVPLDNFGEYSTSVSLAEALGIVPEKPFAPYFGALCGVFGKTETSNLQDLRKKFQSAAGHNISLYNYSSSEITGRKAAVIGGGGNSIDFLREISENKVSVLLTGIAAKNSHSAEAHRFAEEHKISILGGTHYSTEKFACIRITEYFRRLGLASEFIEDIPVMEDM